MEMVVIRAQFQEAIRQFDAGDYFDCHETLEALWRATTDPLLRDFYQGLLQVGVGFYHWQNANAHGTRIKLRQGLVKLARLAANPEARAHDTLARLLPQIALMPFLRQVRACLALAEPGETEDELPPFPTLLIPRLAA